ncbi:hypothetical protein CPB84DRAFT_1846344 [Gymnopilus junonius]|uniref:Chromo domain-containing protein n=1 Tax=Gymnopilus junonius TaxID=109634 RepID=A0A9P5TP23_GYMJU|nr:hypothetical protein CPB84DRAFT_1846344 [Gymnopilus junonius]
MPVIRTKHTDSALTSEGDEEYMPTQASSRLKSRHRRINLPVKRFSGHTATQVSHSGESTTSSESFLSSLPTDNDLSPTCQPFMEPIIVSGVELHPTVAFDTFWQFAAERKAIDDKRRAGLPPPWTNDKILQNYFFCNTFRVLDKGCQYLIQEVIEKGSPEPVELVFRVVLFNTFTKIGTWELLDRHLGPLTWARYDREKYQAVLSNAVAHGMTLYTGAYIKPAPYYGFEQNYMNHLLFLEDLMEHKLANRLLMAPYMANVYEYLISFPSMGPFSTYQLMLSLSYTNLLNFHPNDFVVVGPGSKSGLNKLFGKSMQCGRAEVDEFDTEVMRYLTESQGFHFKRLGLKFSGLGPDKLPMTIADIEHTLCEVILKAELECIPMPMVLPKAWSHRARCTPRIREEKPLVEKRYEVDHLHDHRDTPDGQQYLVYWVGYSPEDATWEFESSLLEDAPATIKAYNTKLGKKGRSKN